MRVLIAGLGSVGGVIAGYLADHPQTSTGLTVLGLARRASLVEHINAQGYAVSGGPRGALNTQGRATTSLDGEAPFDLILLAVRATQVEALAQTLAAHLAPEGAMVCLQNGLCEDRVAAIVGPERVFGGVVAWGAACRGDGIYEMTASAGFRVGRIDGASDPRLAPLAELLSHVAPTEVTDNLAGARWSKLAMNACGSSLSTVSGQTLGQAVLRPIVRRLTLEIITEAVSVARALGVRIEPVAKGIDLNYFCLADADGQRHGRLATWARHIPMLLIGARYRKIRSSMLRALEAGQDPGIETLNGEIVARGQKLGVPTPVNAAVVAVIQEAARGEATLGPALVDEVARRSGVR